MLGLVMGWLVAVFFLGCLLPASFVRSRSIRIPPANERVEVLDRKRVGVYDTVTLASKDGGENVISLLRVR